MIGVSGVIVVTTSEGLVSDEEEDFESLRKEISEGMLDYTLVHTSQSGKKDDVENSI
jgi:hypothetical protein